MQGVRGLKGLDGRDGEPGQQGEQGPQGPPGIGIPPVAPTILSSGKSLDVEKGRHWPSDGAMPDIRLPPVGDWLSIRWREPFEPYSAVSILVPVHEITALTPTFHRAPVRTTHSGALQIAGLNFAGETVRVYAGLTREGLLLLTSSHPLYDLIDLEVGRLTKAPQVAGSPANVTIQPADAGNYEITTNGFFASEANSPKIRIPEEPVRSSCRAGPPDAAGSRSWLLLQLDFNTGTVTDGLHIIDGQQLRTLPPASSVRSTLPRAL